jgi:hypothetical protein
VKPQINSFFRLLTHIKLIPSRPDQATRGLRGELVSRRVWIVKKQVGGLTSAYSLSLSLHTGDSASLTTAGGLKLTPRVSCLGGGVKQTTGGSTPRQFKHWFRVTLGCFNTVNSDLHCRRASNSYQRQAQNKSDGRISSIQTYSRSAHTRLRPGGAECRLVTKNHEGHGPAGRRLYIPMIRFLHCT